MALEDRVNILRRSWDDTWELVNDRLTIEVDRASATLSDRIPGIERIVQSQSATPATASVQSPSKQEDFAQLESRTEARFQAFTYEVDQLREKMAHLVEGQNKHLKEWTRGKLTHVTSQAKGLRSFASHVETVSVVLLRITEPQLWKRLLVKVMKRQVVAVELCRLITQQHLQAHPQDHLPICKSQSHQALHFQKFPRALLNSAPFKMMCEPEPSVLR